MADDAREAQRDEEEQLPRMTLPEHLDELRRRLIVSALAMGVAMIACFVLWKPLWDFVKRPYEIAAAHQGLADTRLWSVDPQEGFMTVLKLCFLAAVVVSSPIVLWQMWGFIAAGLYAHERRIVRIFFPVSVGLFALGMVLAYVLLIPFGLQFLINWNVSYMDVASQFRVGTYVSICLTMVFGMAFFFLMPLVMLFLMATGIVQRKTFRRGWRYAVVISFVIGMLMTDPSPVTQVLFALPLCGLYFLGIWGGGFVGEGGKRFRWYHAWPIVLGLAILVLLIVYADVLNAWSAKIFGGGAAAPSAPVPPGGS